MKHNRRTEQWLITLPHFLFLLQSSLSTTLRAEETTSSSSVASSNFHH
jgi:hypothetical protein